MLFARINEELGRLRPSEQKVATFVLSRPTIAAELTIADLAAEVGVSEPTVMRFCRAVGMKGFQDMKRHVLRDLERRKSISSQSHTTSHTKAKATSQRTLVAVAPIEMVAEVILRQGAIDVLALDTEFEQLALAATQHLAAAMPSAVTGIVSKKRACLEIGTCGPGQLARLIGAPSASGLDNKAPVLLATAGADTFERYKLLIEWIDDLADHLSSVAGASRDRQAERESAFARDRAQALAALPKHIQGGPGAIRPEQHDQSQTSNH